MKFTVQYLFWCLIYREGLSVVEDVDGVKDKVEIEIAKLRAHDSETSGNIMGNLGTSLLPQLLGY